MTTYVCLIHPDLNRVGPAALPRGYEVVWPTGTGPDKRIWAKVDPLIAPDRLPDAEAGSIVNPTGWTVATGTVRLNPRYPTAPGQMHWMAVDPDYQGHGFGEAMTRLCCARLRSLGYGQMQVKPPTYRLSAIALYLKLGFEPNIRADELETWKSVLKKLAGMREYARKVYEKVLAAERGGLWQQKGQEPKCEPQPSKVTTTD